MASWADNWMQQNIMQPRIKHFDDVTKEIWQQVAITATRKASRIMNCDDTKKEIRRRMVITTKRNALRLLSLNWLHKITTAVKDQGSYLNILIKFKTKEIEKYHKGCFNLNASRKEIYQGNSQN